MNNIPKYLFSLLLLVSAPLSARADEKKNDCNFCFAPKKDCKAKKECNTCHVLTKKDFWNSTTRTVSKTFTITEPGTYCFGETIDFSPAEENSRAISVKSSDVKIDLCTKKLQQGNDTPGVVGIELNPGYKNITIENGTICNFQGAGIYSFVDGREIVSSYKVLTTTNAENEVVNAVAGTPINNLTINNTPYVDGDQLIISGIDANGIGIEPFVYEFRNGADSNTIALLIGRGLNLAFPLSVGEINDGVLQLISTGPANPDPMMSLSIEDASGNTGSSNWPAFVVTQEGNDATLDSLCFRNLSITDNVRGNRDRQAGISLDAAVQFWYAKITAIPSYKNIRIENCKVNHNRNLGASIKSADNVAVAHSSFNNTFIDTSSLAVFVTGLSLTGSKNIRLANSSFNNTTAETLFLIAISGAVLSANQNVVIDTCQFNNNGGNNTVFVAGIVMEVAVNFLAQNSQFNNTFGSNIARASGIISTNSEFFASDAGSHTFIDCQFNGSYRGPGNPFFFGGATGFSGDSLKDVIFEGCQSSNLRNEEAAFANCIGFSLTTFNANVATNDNASQRNLTFKNNVVSNLRSLGQASAFSVELDEVAKRPDELINLNNVVFDNNIVENVFGSQAQGINFLNAAQMPQRPLTNASIINNVIGDISSSVSSGAGMRLSGVTNPTLCNNIVDSCDIGISFEGDDNRGYTENGLVQDNKVSNCAVAGYQDLLVPTGSAWVNNTALLNGPTTEENYVITWPNDEQVDEGTLGDLPGSTNKYYNLAIKKS